MACLFATQQAYLSPWS